MNTTISAQTRPYQARNGNMQVKPVPSSKYPCKLTDAELADPEYMRSYIEAMNQDYADLLYAQLVQAPEPEGRCKECLTYNGHQDGCSKAQEQRKPMSDETKGD